MNRIIIDIAGLGERRDGCGGQTRHVKADPTARVGEMGVAIGIPVATTIGVAVTVGLSSVRYGRHPVYVQ